MFQTELIRPLRLPCRTRPEQSHELLHLNRSMPLALERSLQRAPERARRSWRCNRQGSRHGCGCSSQGQDLRVIFTNHALLEVFYVFVFFFSDGSHLTSLGFLLSSSTSLYIVSFRVLLSPDILFLFCSVSIGPEHSQEAIKLRFKRTFCESSEILKLNGWKD